MIVFLADLSESVTVCKRQGQGMEIAGRGAGRAKSAIHVLNDIYSTYWRFQLLELVYIYILLWQRLTLYIEPL